MSKKKSTPGRTVVCRNPKARHRFDIEEKVEAGMVLTGSEVKSLRNRHANLEGAFAAFLGEELFLSSFHIAPYAQAHVAPHEPLRSRKLLLSRNELQRWQGRTTQKGYSIVPLEVYFRDGWAKVELGLGKGKRVKDKREEIKRTQDLKEARRAMERGRDAGRNGS